MAEKSYDITYFPAPEDYDVFTPKTPEVIEVVTREMGRVIAKRSYEVVVLGPSDGKPVAWIGGSPIGAQDTFPEAHRLYQMGVRIYSIGKPGYGEASEQQDRQVSHAAQWAEEVMTGAYGIEEYAVFGRSGGGPHALAVAAGLPHRVSKAAALSSPSPYDPTDILWISDMSKGNRELAALAAAGDKAALKRAYDLIRLSLLDDDRALFRNLESDPEKPLSPDALSLFRKRLISLAHRLAMERRSDGWVGDSIATYDPNGWGFNLGAIECPTLLTAYRGDQHVPSRHAIRLARAIGKNAIVLEGEGSHFMNFDIADLVLAWLITDDPEREKRILNLICKEIEGVMPIMTGWPAFC